ncbi:MAG: hypothetical protein D3923_13130, partial [Candidatus Electrothrix sp. AR3]|nr:hypothetical protein [Candidatus Electrothrix sp. AR3]
ASYQLEKKPLSAVQNVFQGRSFLADIQTIVEKPTETDLKTFLDSPKMIMDNLLKAIPYHRYMGTEKIRITSFGEPEKKTVWQDKLGRKWTSSLWYGEYNDYFVYSHCLPYPKGALCLLDDNQTSFLKLGYIESLRDGCDEISLGYEGELDDWVEYFALGQKHLPSFFDQANILRNGDQIKISLKNFISDFKQKEINGASSLHLHLGYSNTQLLTEELVRFELFPTKGKDDHYRIQPFFTPSPFSSDTYIALWNEGSQGIGEFSGKMLDRGAQHILQKTALQTKKALTTFEGKEIESVFVVGCAYNGVAEEEEIKQDCELFFQGIDFDSK